MIDWSIKRACATILSSLKWFLDELDLVVPDFWKSTMKGILVGIGKVKCLWLSPLQPNLCVTQGSFYRCMVCHWPIITENGPLQLTRIVLAETARGWNRLFSAYFPKFWSVLNTLPHCVSQRWVFETYWPNFLTHWDSFYGVQKYFKSFHWF